MTTFEDFLDNDYKEYEVSSIKSADRFCQKTIHSWNRKKAYFINVYFYDLTKHCGHLNINKDNLKSIACEVDFYSDDNWFNVALNDCQLKSIKEIESFFAKIYNTMECIPDIYNND